MQLAIQGQSVETWPPDVWAKWHDLTDKLPRDQGYYIRANYFEPRPWRNEYDRGNANEGFCYTVTPGRRVCLAYLPKEKD